jgi:hypothetical protein
MPYSLLCRLKEYPSCGWNETKWGERSIPDSPALP